MTATQYILLAITLISAPLGVKLLDYGIITFKNWWNKRRDKQISASQNQQELEKLRLMKDIDVSKIKSDQFQNINDAWAKIAEEMTKRAHGAEEIVQILKGKLEEYDGKIDRMIEEVKSCVMIREQMEIDERLMYDTFSIAYWEVTPDGRVYGNATFLRLTGLGIAKCHNDGWFEAIEETARERCRNFWQAFIENHQTRPALPFSFRNMQTGDITHTTVFCGARMRNITDVYKYTARTKPLALPSVIEILPPKQLAQ